MKMMLMTMMIIRCKGRQARFKVLFKTFKENFICTIHVGPMSLETNLYSVSEH